MKRLKLLALTLLSGLCLMLFCACAETFTVTSYTDAAGAVHREYLLTYDAAAEDAAEVKEETLSVMRSFIDWRSLADYAVIDDSVEGQVTLRVVFPSATDYYIYLGYTGREENEAVEPTKRGFVDIYDTEIETYLTEQTKEDIRFLMNESYRDLPWDIEFYYRYGTTSRTLKSNGKQTEENGIYFHTWRLDMNGDADMRIRSYHLNAVYLYLIVISVFVLSLAIIFVIIYINKRKEKRRAAEPRDDSQPLDGEDSVGEGRKE